LPVFREDIDRLSKPVEDEFNEKPLADESRRTDPKTVADKSHPADQEAKAKKPRPIDHIRRLACEVTIAKGGKRRISARDRVLWHKGWSDQG